MIIYECLAHSRDLFNEAKKYSPAIIYIDEIDAIGRQRSSGPIQDGSQEREQTLNQLLVEMDGLLSKSGVVLLASTNRLDILDKVKFTISELVFVNVQFSQLH